MFSERSQDPQPALRALHELGSATPSLTSCHPRLPASISQNEPLSGPQDARPLLVFACLICSPWNVLLCLKDVPQECPPSSLCGYLSLCSQRSLCQLLSFLKRSRMYLSLFLLHLQLFPRARQRPGAHIGVCRLKTDMECLQLFFRGL